MRMPLASTYEIIPETSLDYKSNWMGDKRYELSNHLGNVLVVVSDRKLSNPSPGNNQVAYFEPDVVSYSDYYPFAMFSDACFLSDEKLSRTNPDKAQAKACGLSGQMPGRKDEGDGDYRYGFKMY